MGNVSPEGCPFPSWRGLEVAVLRGYGTESSAAAPRPAGRDQPRGAAAESSGRASQAMEHIQGDDAGLAAQRPAGPAGAVPGRLGQPLRRPGRGRRRFPDGGVSPEPHRGRLRPVRSPAEPTHALGLLRASGAAGGSLPGRSLLFPPWESRLPLVLVRFLFPPPAPGRGCGGDPPPLLPAPQNAHPRSRLHPPPGGRTGRRGPQTFVLFYRDVSSHAVHRVHASGRPLGPPLPKTRDPRGRPLPPSPPHRPHPTGQVLSLLEIKVHSLWCRGAAATASCFTWGWLSLSLPHPKNYAPSRADPAPTCCK